MPYYSIINDFIQLYTCRVSNENIAWLNNFPTVARHFEESLRIYMDKDKAKYRNLLDNLRFSMEQLFRIILNNRTCLENQKSHIGSWLQSKGIHSEIREMYTCLITHFAKYQNDAIKHGDDWMILPRFRGQVG